MSALADYIDASIGRKPLSLLIKNCKLLNVFTGEIYSTSIGIYKDKLVLVDDAPNRSEVENVIDADGMLALPGLSDTDVQVESSVVIPYRCGEAVLPHG